MTNNPAADTNPAWSLDSKKLAFQSDRKGNSDIFVMDAFAGAEATGILTDPAEDKQPFWGK